MIRYLIAPLLLLPLAGCVDRAAQATAARTQKSIENPVQAVSTLAVQPTTLVETLEITGAISSTDDAQVGAQVPGRVVRVLVQEGSPVTGGQIVAVQDTTNARMALRQARSQLATAQAALRSAVSEAQVGPERSRAAVRAARAQLGQAESQLLKARNGARPEERRQAEAQVEAARTNMEIAKKQLDRGQELFREGAISERELDGLRSQYANSLAAYESSLQQQKIVQNATRVEDIQTLESQVTAAREQLHTALANQRLDVQFADRVAGARAQVESAREQVGLAQQQIEDANVRAPFGGRVAGKPLQPGTYVGPGTPILRIIGQGGIAFDGEVPESKISQVAPGMTVGIRVDALRNRAFVGRVAAINASAESLGRLFRVRIEFEGTPPELKAGMFARGTVEVGRRDNVLATPSEAIRTEGAKSFVFVIEAGKAVRREVQVGLVQGGRTEVKSGLRPDDQVVVRGQSVLSDGTPVRVENPTSRS